MSFNLIKFKVIGRCMVEIIIIVTFATAPYDYTRLRARTTAETSVI